MDGGTLAAQALEVLHLLTGDPQARFRPGQLEAIEALVVRRERVLVVQRTGWGKSAVYFIATRLLRERGGGPTLLISPLLALMRNQQEAAARAGIRAVSLNSSNRADWDDILAALRRDEVDVLLVSEMRLHNDAFREHYLPLVGDRAGLLVVDEVHCISDWGHDFRPHYRRIARFLDLLSPGTPVLGCTATANDRVVTDVQRQLGERLTTLRGPLDREGLSLQVIDLPDPADRLAWLAQNLPAIPGTGIVYCLTVRDTERVAGFLRDVGIDALAYSGVDDSDSRHDVEQRLLRNDVKVVVATSALGMGFDKPDLAFVIHYQMPGSPLAYYQQVGRAGRQLDRSLGVGLRGGEDTRIQDWFISTAFPTPEQADAVIAALDAADKPLSVPMIESQVNVRRSRLESMLVQLEVEGVVQRDGARWSRTLAPWRYPHERVAAVTAIRRAEQEVMRDYATTDRCRMEVLRVALDDSGAEPCGVCDNCGAPFGREPIDGSLRRRAREWLLGVQHVPIAPRKQWPRGLSDPSGGIPAGHRFEAGFALCSWGDPQWGEMVRAGKQVDGHFSDALVDGFVDMLVARGLAGPVTWITAVPSTRSGELVPSLAQRVAVRLARSYVGVLRKTRETEPQKTRENSAQQVRNLWGAFEVTGDLPDGPVLLIDDIVDSRWTFTVVAHTLRSAGSGPVYVAALAHAAGS
ncbi:MAG: RecQ family ATP-dependent DNA helicase [Actinomyces sp.]|nr:MAG: RecQ family ATP-dependent DNA helicase [Actinomyces sp.]